MPPAPPEPDQADRPYLIGLDADVPLGADTFSGYSLFALSVFATIVLGSAVYMLALRYVALPLLPSLGINALILAAIGWFVYRVVRARFNKAAIDDPPKKIVLGTGRESGREGRLLVVGKKDDLARFVALGAPAEGSFEPLIFFAPRIIKLPRGATPMLIVTTLAVFGLIMLLRFKTTLPLLNVGWFNVMFGVAVGVGVQMLIWPTYLRIAPGRVDVMRFTIGARKPATTTIDLRNAEVLVNFKLKAIFIRPAQHPPEAAETESPPTGPPPANHHRWTTLNLRGVWRPKEVAHAILQGAVSTAPTPPLPDDQLTG